MDAQKLGSGDRISVFIGGEPFEIWENPDCPFGNDDEDVDTYAAAKKWVLLFNALVLSGTDDTSPISPVTPFAVMPRS